MNKETNDHIEELFAVFLEKRINLNEIKVRLMKKKERMVSMKKDPKKKEEWIDGLID